MFYVDCGWLHYKPFLQYKLPSLVLVDEHGATFQRKGATLTTQTKPLCKLLWPGKLYKDDLPVILPHAITKNWPGCKDQSQDRPLQALLPKLPSKLPELLAYHLAVNAKTYGYQGGWRHRSLQVASPVAGLPAKTVQTLLDVEFAIDGDSWAALTYLKWMAENHRRHPFFEPFDTVVRDELVGLSIKAARLFFYLLRDCLYDRENKWWARSKTMGPIRHYWDSLACYFHWVGRTGCGLYANHSGVSGLLDGSQRSLFGPSFGELFPEIVEQMKAWDAHMDEHRANSHEDGFDPCHPIDVVKS